MPSGIVNFLHAILISFKVGSPDTQSCLSTLSFLDLLFYHGNVVFCLVLTSTLFVISLYIHFEG